MMIMVVIVMMIVIIIAMIVIVMAAIMIMTTVMVMINLGQHNSHISERWTMSYYTCPGQVGRNTP